MRLDDLKRQIGSLSSRDQDDLVKFIKAGRSLGGSNASPKKHDGRTSIEDVLLETISQYARDKGIEFVTVERLRASQQMKQAREKLAEGLEDYLRNAVAKNRIELRAFMKLAISLVFKEMAQLRLSASGRTVLAYVHRIPAVINKAFPGYASSGMLHLIFQRDNMEGGENVRSKQNRRPKGLRKL
jgi:hypothetical protein